MTTIDLRPPGFTVPAWPGQVRSITVTGFPAGYLTGKTHEWRLVRAGRSEVYATEAAVIDGTSLVTASFDVPLLTGEWQVTLYETTGSLEEPRLGFDLDVDRAYSSVQTDITIPVAIDTGAIQIDLDVTLVEGGGGGGGQVDEVVAGDGISVDDTDPTAPIITAEVTQAELDAKVAIAALAELVQDIVGAMVSGNTETGLAVTYDDSDGTVDLVAEVTTAILNAALALKADLASPALTGNPTAPTQAPGSNNTRLATTEFVTAALTVLIGTAPGVLDTLGEIADAINDDANLYTTLVAAIAAKVSDTAYDATSWNGVVDVAPSKNAVRDAIEGLSATYAPLAGATFTGDVVVPDEAYGVGWDTSLEVPTKNALYDKVEALDAAKQAADGDLTAISGLSPSNDDVIQRKAGAWTNRTMAQLIADLAALGTTFAPKTPTVGTALGTTGTVDLDLAALDGTVQWITATGDITFTTSNRAAGRNVRVFVDAGGSARTLTYPSWTAHGAALDTALASGKRMAISILSLGTTDANISAVTSEQP